MNLMKRTKSAKYVHLECCTIAALEFIQGHFLICCTIFSKGTKDAYPFILPASTRGLHFASKEQKARYEILATRKTSEQKYFHVDSLRTLGMLNDMLHLICKLGWTEYIDMQRTSYDRFMREFLSSLNVNWDGTFRGREGEISFHMFNVDHRMNLRMFNELLKFPIVNGEYRDVPSFMATRPRLDEH